MVEVALVFDMEGRVVWWPSPKDNSSGSIPDSHLLWYHLWENRDRVGGVAHTHPWYGPTSPSHTDVTTFSAIERGLGRPLLWPIVTMTHVNYFCRNMFTGEYVNAAPVSFKDTDWWEKNITEMRRLSSS